MSNLIYAYKRRSTNKIVYVGQTKNLKERNLQHIKYDPYNPNAREYNYPLSRGIRKYGENEYELIILEDNLPDSLLDEREKYWITYYNTYYDGYNQTLGGSNPVMPIFDDKLVDLIIHMLREQDISMQEISDKTGVSLTHIYNINTGDRRRRDGITYPIRSNKAKGTRGSVLSQDDVKEIHNLLSNTFKTMKDIAQAYGCDASTIRRINKGQTKMYRLDNYSYPIRSK